MDIHK